MSDLPLAGHELLRWRQTQMIDSRLVGGIDHPQEVYGCSCGERGPVGMQHAAMWFIAHCLIALGADGGPQGFGRSIDDDDAQRLWFSKAEGS
jgi:hypothetical protein